MEIKKKTAFRIKNKDDSVGKNENEEESRNDSANK